ncbi:hypothetical protein AVEN_197002-1 [Araneus ventricosus]|uniref:Uncharacterized protein n=1 Tax=Araneus ventricosus TaxID=182803 RepID=A0A4Y2EB77_ARAVE|nr:hypothetical protein AVEN_197002-1 [Araneus ventricosus]
MCAGCVINLMLRVKGPPDDVVWKFGEGVPAHVSSLSSDYGSELRDPSQSSPHVASKQIVNITQQDFGSLSENMMGTCSSFANC